MGISCLEFRFQPRTKTATTNFAKTNLVGNGIEIRVHHRKVVPQEVVIENIDLRAVVCLLTIRVQCWWIVHFSSKIEIRDQKQQQQRQSICTLASLAREGRNSRDNLKFL